LKRGLEEALTTGNTSQFNFSAIISGKSAAGRELMLNIVAMPHNHVINPTRDSTRRFAADCGGPAGYRGRYVTAGGTRTAAIRPGVMFAGIQTEGQAP